MNADLSPGEPGGWCSLWKSLLLILERVKRQQCGVWGL